MFDGPEIANALVSLGVTHVVWPPDSALGPWETALETSTQLSLVRVCREGEAWTLAAGLYLGGKSPVVVIQNTGLFESGDALRNVLFDMQLPLFSIIGYRSYLVPNATDTAKLFTEAILQAWNISPVLLDTPDKLPLLSSHYLSCQQQSQPGVVLIAEGRM